MKKTIESIKILNKYRNSYYNSPIGTEENQVANALNDLLTKIEEFKKYRTPMNTRTISKGHGHYEHECPSCNLSIGYTSDVRYNHPFEFCPGCGQRVIYTDVKESIKK